MCGANSFSIKEGDEIAGHGMGFGVLENNGRGMRGLPTAVMATEGSIVWKEWIPKDALRVEITS